MSSRLKKCKKISATLLLLFLVACGGYEPVSSIPATESIVSNGDVVGYIVVPTPNGDIPCIIFDTYNGGGISCDWNAR